jgi:membrane-associated phospholipid phosphatase
MMSKNDMFMRKIIFSFILFYFSSYSLLAQDSIDIYPEENFFQRVKNDGIITGRTIIEAYKRPFQWKKKEWLMAGSVLAISAAASLLDQPIYNYYEENSGKNPLIAKIATVGDFMGQPEHNYPFMMTLWGLGVITKNEWLRDTGILLTASITSSGLVQTALKEVVGRARPATGKGPYAFKPFGGPAYHSFPSGHTMLALASAYVLAHQIDFMPLRIIVFGIPVVTGFSRIHDGAHFFSDIILGSAIGIAFAEAVMNLYPKIKAEQRSKISLVPTMKGFKLAYRF